MWVRRLVLLFSPGSGYACVSRSRNFAASREGFWEQLKMWQVVWGAQSRLDIGVRGTGKVSV